MKTPSILLVGVNGYASGYVKKVLDLLVGPVSGGPRCQLPEHGLHAWSDR